MTDLHQVVFFTVLKLRHVGLLHHALLATFFRPIRVYGTTQNIAILCLFRICWIADCECLWVSLIGDDFAQRGRGSWWYKNLFSVVRLKQWKVFAGVDRLQNHNPEASTVTRLHAYQCFSCGYCWRTKCAAKSREYWQLACVQIDLC